LAVSVVVQGAERLLEGNLMMGKLVDLMKSTIDRYRGTSGQRTTGSHTHRAPTGWLPYASCVVVGI
jgi:hypothetical protein